MLMRSPRRIAHAPRRGRPTRSRPWNRIAPRTSAVRREQAHQRERERRLPASGFADQAEDLALGDLERHVACTADTSAGPLRKSTSTRSISQERGHRVTPRGSRRSRRPSPIRLNASTGDRDREPGEDLDPRRLRQHVAPVGEHHAERRRRAAVRPVPGTTAPPRSASANPSGRSPGRWRARSRSGSTWRTTIRRDDAPRARAASMNGLRRHHQRRASDDPREDRHVDHGDREERDRGCPAPRSRSGRSRAAGPATRAACRPAA